MATAPQSGMKKRQIIASSNRTMFLWVAGMSAVVGVCAVLSYFLIQQIIFVTRVTSVADNTVSVLQKNNTAAPKLLENMRVLETNSALNSIKARSDDKALQVILDALPADKNSLALGSSLQQKLITGIDGLSIESLAVLPLSDEGVDSTTAQKIPLSLVVSAKDANALKDLLARFEKSIRVIDIDTLSLERSENSYTMSITAHAYYLPAKTVQLTDKVVKPNEKK